MEKVVAFGYNTAPKWAFKKRAAALNDQAAGKEGVHNHLKDESYVELVIDLINLASVKVVSFGLIAHQLPL